MPCTAALHLCVKLTGKRLYGRPATSHGAFLIEDAAEAMGATLNGRQGSSFGDYSAISYNGNKIITGSAGGCLLTNVSVEFREHSLRSAS